MGYEPPDVGNSGLCVWGVNSKTDHFEMSREIQERRKLLPLGEGMIGQVNGSNVFKRPLGICPAAGVIQSMVGPWLRGMELTA